MNSGRNWAPAVSQDNRTIFLLRQFPSSTLPLVRQNRSKHSISKKEETPRQPHWHPTIFPWTFPNGKLEISCVSPGVIKTKASNKSRVPVSTSYLSVKQTASWPKSCDSSQIPTSPFTYFPVQLMGVGVWEWETAVYNKGRNGIWWEHTATSIDCRKMSQYGGENGSFFRCDC